MKNHAWKLVGVILFLVILNRGLLTPLKHGITDVQPSRLQAGKSVQLSIAAYNSHYQVKDQIIRVFIRPHAGGKGTLQNLMIEAKAVEVISATQLKASFDIPLFLPEYTKLGQYSLIVDSPLDGAAVIPSKLILSQDSTDWKLGVSLWTPVEEIRFSQANLSHFPYRNILVETIRNTFFHVSLWFAMFLLLSISVYHSFRYLKTSNPDADLRAFALVKTGLLFGVLGCITGSLWARYTWETWWTTDIKLNMAALSMMIYLAYLILRASIEEVDRKRRIAAAYNVFALVAVIPLIFVLPRLTDSLHPGNGGNPAFGSDDMDNALRVIFYPAVIAFMLLGCWLADLMYRTDKLALKQNDLENNS